MMTINDPIIANPRGSAKEALSFFANFGEDEDRDLLITEVFGESPPYGFDPSISIAHMSHETDYFRSRWWRERRNPAGFAITGMKEQNESSPYFTVPTALYGYLSHMSMYTRGWVVPPLTEKDDPRFDAYIDSYGRQPMAKTISDLEFTWSWDSAFAEGVARQGNEIFPNLPHSSLVYTPTLVRSGENVWNGMTNIRMNNILYRAQRRMVTVSTFLNVRRYADTSSDIFFTAPRGYQFFVLGYVQGEKVGNESRWWVTYNHERIWVGGTSEKPL